MVVGGMMEARTRLLEHDVILAAREADMLCEEVGVMWQTLLMVTSRDESRPRTD